MVIETQRLILRGMIEDDFDALYRVLADSDIMQHYPYTVRQTPMKSVTCWKAWHRKTIHRRRIAMKKPCGALSTARKGTARTSILPRTMHTAMR